jgi:hypothetical protein
LCIQGENAEPEWSNPAQDKAPTWKALEDNIAPRLSLKDWDKDDDEAEENMDFLLS